MKNARGVPGRNVYINVNESSGRAGFVTLSADFWRDEAQKLANPGANFWRAAKIGGVGWQVWAGASGFAFSSPCALPSL